MLHFVSSTHQFMKLLQVIRGSSGVSVYSSEFHILTPPNLLVMLVEKLLESASKFARRTGQALAA